MIMTRVFHRCGLSRERHARSSSRLPRHQHGFTTCRAFSARGIDAVYAACMATVALPGWLSAACPTRTLRAPGAAAPEGGRGGDVRVRRASRGQRLQALPLRRSALQQILFMAASWLRTPKMIMTIIIMIEYSAPLELSSPAHAGSVLCPWRPVHCPKEVRILSDVLSPTNPAMRQTHTAEHVR